MARFGWLSLVVAVLAAVAVWLADRQSVAPVVASVTAADTPPTPPPRRVAGAPDVTTTVRTTVGPPAAEDARPRLRGTIHDASGLPCGGAPIHRVARPEGASASYCAPDPSWATALGETTADGEFAIPLDQPLGAAEWIEFAICEVAFVRYRPARGDGTHALIVPTLRETVIDLVGGPPTETWTVETHPAEMRDDKPLLRAFRDDPVPTPQGELVVRLHYHGWDPRGTALRTLLPDVERWALFARAESLSVVEPYRVVEAGARVLFDVGPPAQRIFVEVVDDDGDRVAVGGQVAVEGEKGWSNGTFEGGRAVLRPPAGTQIEGDLTYICRLQDGETFVGTWPESLWRDAPRVTLHRGAGVAPVVVTTGGLVEAVTGVGPGGAPVWLEHRQPDTMDGTWWWDPTPDGRAIRVCVDPRVQELWCVGGSADDPTTPGRLGVAERTSSADFGFAWRAGTTAEFVLGTPRDGLQRVVLRARIPGLPVDERGSWVSLRTWTGPRWPDTFRAHRPDGVDTEVLVIREVDGALRRTDAAAIWR